MCMSISCDGTRQQASAPHATARRVLNGQRHFSTRIVESCGAHGRRAKRLEPNEESGNSLPSLSQVKGINGVTKDSGLENVRSSTGAQPHTAADPVQRLVVRSLKSEAGGLNLQPDATVHEKLKSMEELPGPSLSTTVYWLFWKGYADKSHALQTSNTMSWTLYHLARDPEVQNRLYQEVVSVCPDRKLLSTEDLSRIPYLKAFIKETLRLYPVVTGNGRLAVENEVVVGGYWFPKQTQFHLCHYAASHDETVFPDAEAFIPERWLRGGPLHSQHHPYSSIPFGVGVRACFGETSG